MQRSARWKFSHLLPLTALLTAALLSYAAPSGSAGVEGRASQEGVAAATTDGAQEGQNSCCGQDADKPHFLAASYYNVGNNLTATLMLNNKGPQPVEVRPTLFSLSGERLEVAPLTVEGESFRNVNLRDMGALPGTPFEEGSLQLFHRGSDLVIGAQLYLADEGRSLSFDEKLTEFQGAASTRLEGVWWLPSRRATVSLVLSNTGDSEVAADVVVNAGTPHPEMLKVALSPHETRVIKVRRELPGRGPKSRDDVGGASISYSGPKGSLLARALIADETSGYSLSAQFYSPQGGKSSGYQGVGLRLGTASGEEFTPVVVARNVGDETAYLSGRMPYTKTDGSAGVVRLPKVKLAAGEASGVDVERAIRTQVRSQEIATASLEFEYTTPPGSVMMSAQSVSAGGNHVFRVPMWDVPAQRNGTGGYPWFIDGTSSTFVYIKNVTDEEQSYTFSLTYEGGVYATGVKKVEGGQTVAYDLRAMRDGQVPDERGRTIPLDAARGKIVWSVRGPDSLALLGRSEQADLVKGTSSSYACFMCCPNSFRRSRVEEYLGSIFGPISVPEGGVTNLRSVEQDMTCYGGNVPEYYMGDTWSSSNTSVLTADGFGDAADITAVGVGSATVKGHWEVYSYTSFYSFEHDTHMCEESSSVTEPARTVQVINVEKIQYQSGSNFVNITDTLYVLKGTGVTFKAIPNPSTATFPSGQPVWSGSSGATGTGSTVSVTFNTASANATDFKTVTATSGNGVTVNVLVYELTPTTTPQDNFTGRSTTDYGLKEIVNLAFTTSPTVTAAQAGGLNWSKKTGVGTVTPTAGDVGTGTYDAGDAVGAATLSLKVVAGPSKDQERTVIRNVVAPSNASMTQAPGTGIRHEQHHVHVGFRGVIRLSPTNVSFANIHFQEGNGTATASGCWAFENNRVHPATGVALSIGGCNVATGCLVNAIDTVESAGIGPYPAPPPTPAYCTGDFVWPIAWQYSINGGTSWTTFTTATHHHWADPAPNLGRANIEKKGAGPFSRHATDPTSNY